MTDKPCHKLTLNDVAVIVATRDEARYLAACVSSILRAARQKAEVIIVDDGSMDNSSIILQTFEDKVRIFHLDGRGPGAARNWAMRQTDRSWVAFTDGDCVVSDDWLVNLIAATDGKHVDVISVGGPQQVPLDASVFEKKVAAFFAVIGFVSDYLNCRNTIEDVAHHPSCNSLYKKSAIEMVHGFDETLWPCEDLDLDIRLRKGDLRALFAPAAVVSHHRPESLGQLWKMMQRYGWGHAQLVKKHGLCQKLHILPVTAVAGLLGILVALLRGEGLLVGFLLFFGFGLTCLAFVIRTGSVRHSWRYANWLVLCSCGWLFGFAKGMVSSTRIAGHA